MLLLAMAKRYVKDQQHSSEETQIIKSVLGGILVDDSMTLPMKGSKKCFELAMAMVQCYSCYTFWDIIEIFLLDCVNA